MFCNCGVEMGSEMVSSWIALCFSAVTLLILVGEKLFGGGTALANKFHTLERETTKSLSDLRIELDTKINEYERTATVGFEAVKSNIHAMQMGLLEFRAQMAEGLHSYIRKDDYNAGLDGVKRDVHAGFTRVDTRLGELQDLIVYGNPEAAGKVLKRQ